MKQKQWILYAGLALALISPFACAGEEHRERGVGDVVYVPTPQVVVDEMLSMAKVGPQDFVIDLGSGDGRMVITAAKKFGARGFGVDLSDELLLESNKTAQTQGVADRAVFIKQNLFETDLSPATVITTYLLPSMNEKLRPKILSMKPGTRVVAHDYHMGDWNSDEQKTLSVPEKKVGEVGKSFIYLWCVPAKIAGRWQAQIAAGAQLANWEFEFDQRYQMFDGTARSGDQKIAMRSTRLAADQISFQFLTKPGDNSTRYEFNGTVKGDAIDGTLKIGEGAAQKQLPWSAKIVQRAAGSNDRAGGRSAGGAQPKPSLSLVDAIAMIVRLIGAGIFGTPAIVAGAAGSEAWMIGVWIAGGVFAIIGALCYAELATAFPSAGGEYHFIQRAYGRSLAFLYGWARMTVIVAGSIAVFAYLFGDYMSRIANLGPYSSAIWAALVVGILTIVNYLGIREGKITQDIFTLLEVSGLVLIVIAGLILAPAPAAAPSVAAGAGQPWYMGMGLGTAMLFVLFTYGGWNDAAYISAEVRDRERNMVRALLYSICLVTVLYVLVNLAYLKGLGYSAMARSDAVAADLLKSVWGATGEKLISVIIAIAALTSVNGSMIVGARSNYALGKDWPLLGFLGRWDEASGSPRTAMLVQGAIALTLVAFGAMHNAGFKELVEYSLPVFWGFFMLVGIALFVLRVKEPNAPRPFRVPGYPVAPAIFVLMCAYLLYSSLVFHRTHALVGLGVLAVGAVILLFARSAQRQS